MFRKLAKLLSFGKGARARDTDTTSESYFESKYARSEDPWGFASSSYELSRYGALITALPDRTFERAFEPGCSVGVLTGRLAKKCLEVHAIDISATAVMRAQERCRHLQNVHIRQGALPGAIPDGSFDLIVFSEIGYYFEADALRGLLGALTERMKPGGVFLAGHWLGESPDHILDGDQVHSVIRQIPGMKLTLEERHAAFRVDRLMRE